MEIKKIDNWLLNNERYTQEQREFVVETIARYNKEQECNHNKTKQAEDRKGKTLYVCVECEEIIAG
jgi:ribosomal protein L37AE/L43A